MTKTKNISLKVLVNYIKSAKNILIATHESPDGDGLGSIIALGDALKQLGKKVTLYNIDGVPKMYHFLPGHKEITNKLNPKTKFDLSIIVDLGEIERCGTVFVNHPHRNTTISIDHHAKGAKTTDYCFCLPQQASSGEVVYKILKTLKTKFNNKIATGIYTAIVTDTGSFKYSNTNKETFAIAADLLNFGVNVWEVALNCFETYSLARMQLLQHVLKTLEIHKNKKVAWVVLTKKDYAKAKALPEDSEGLINFPRSIEGVEVAMLVKEQKPSQYKISMRSKQYVDVAAVAKKYGGGGHIRASGCSVKGSLAQVKKQILAEILKRL